MSLYEAFKETYLTEDLIDYFIDKRKFILENNKKDYLNYLIKENLVEEDLARVTKLSLDLFVAEAQTILIHNKKIVKNYSNLNEEKMSWFLSEVDKRLKCSILNKITYKAELEEDRESIRIPWED